MRKKNRRKKDRRCIKILQLKQQLKEMEKKIDTMLTKTSANEEKAKKDIQ